MKIQLTCTQTEAIQLIKQYKSDVDDVVIVSDGQSYMGYAQAILRVTRIEFPNYMTNEKISAIKRLRELVAGLGLADAKAAIENVNNAILHYLKTGKPLPLY